MTGSYDTTIKLWDKRKLAIELSTIFSPENIQMPNSLALNTIETSKSVWDIKFRVTPESEEHKADLMGI